MAGLFHTAERRKAKLRLALTGPSGSGKTYSALLIAKGLTGDLSRVALIDTEHGSGELYADLGPYAVLTLTPPFAPDRYIKAIKAAEGEGFAVVVIDSLSHAWSGEGGLLDYVDMKAKSSRSGNSFAAWREGTPKQNELIDTMLGAGIHVIATMRSKVEWTLEENEKGKKTPRKLGLAPEQRKDVDYEFTAVFDISREHVATASKDRTGLFDERVWTPDEATGAELLEWLDRGAEPPAVSPPVDPLAEPTASAAEIGELLALAARKGRSPEQVQAAVERKAGFIGPLADLPASICAALTAGLASLPDAASPEPAPAVASAPAPAEPVQAPLTVDPVTGEVSGGEANEEDELDALLGKRAPTPIDEKQMKRIGALLRLRGIAEEVWRAYLQQQFGVSSRTQLTYGQAHRFIKWIEEAA